MQGMDALKWWAAVGLTATVAACGGGGGGGSVGMSAHTAQSGNAGAGDGTAAAVVPAGSSSAPGPERTSSAAAPAGSTTPSAAPGQPLLIESRVSEGGGFAQIDPIQKRDAKRHVLPPAGAVMLPAMNSAKSGAPSAQKSEEAQGIRVKIGDARAVQATATAADLGAQLNWVPSARDGKVAALRFVSTGAQGVRLGLKVDSLPLGGVVRFYADGSNELFEIPAQEILATIQRNLDAGVEGDAARTYWSPNLGGEALTVEFEVPPGTSAEAVQVAVPALSHVFVDVRNAAEMAKAGSGSCNQDVRCSSEYNELSKSVAFMDFVKDGDSYMCTGTLLNDRMSSGTPYFLSANHCIPTQDVASSLITLWFGTSATCNSTQINPGFQMLFFWGHPAVQQ